MVIPFRRPSRDYVLMLLIVAAVLVLLVGIYLHEIQALLPIASMLLALRITLQSDDRNVRRFAGVLTFGFAASTLSNIAWYLVPAVVDYSFVGTDNYYYVTGIFWIIGYVAIAYVLLKLKNSRQWYLERRLDRGLTVAGVIACILIGLFVFLNMDWSSSHLTDIYILLIYLALDVMILMLSVKLLAMNLKIGLRHLLIAATIFFLVNMAGDLLFVSRWLFNLSKLLTLQVGNFQTTLTIRNATNDIYNFSLTLMTVLLFLFALDPLRTGKIDEIRGRLKDTQLFVDDLIAKSPDATCIFDRHGRLVLVNDTFLQIFGLKRNDIDRSFNIFSHIGEKMFNKEAHAEMLKVRDAGTVIIPKLKLTGIPGGRQEDIYLYLKMFPTYGSGGRVSNYVMIIEDITARIEIEMALRQSEEKFRALTEMAPVAICILEDGRFKYANPAMENISGYSKEELLSINFLDMVHPDALEYVRERYGEWAGGEGQGEFRSVLKCIRRDGKVCWIDLSRKTIEYQGRPGLLLAGIDITERKRMEDAIQYERSQLLSIFDSIDEIIYVADPFTYEILFANKAMQEKFGKKLIGGTCYKEFQNKDAPCEFCTNPVILKYEGVPYRWEFHNPILNRDLLIVDRIIKWPDGRDVRFEYAIDITERKQAEKALRESEEKFRAVFEQAAVGITWVDLEGRFLQTNQKFGDITGYTSDELTQRSVSDITYAPDIPEEKELIGKLLRGEIDAFSREKRYVRKDGSLIWVFLRVSLIRENGIPKNLVGVTQDITERKQFEEALRESEDKYRNIVEQSSDGILISDERGIIVEFNAAQARITGRDPKDWIGRYLWDYIAEITAARRSSPDQKESLRAAIMAASKGGYRGFLNSEMEVTIRRPDGEIRSINISSFVTNTHRGKIFGSMVRDVTERKRIEEALRESEEQYRNLVENVGEWIWENDRESRFTYSSPKVYDLLGYRPEEVIGLAPHDLMTPENAEKLREQVKRLEEKGEFPQVLEVELLHKDGHTVFLEVTGKPVYDRQGNHTGFRGVSRDVTARKQANKALRESEASLAKAQAMAHIGSWEWDGRKGKSRWSDELYAICGLDKATFEPSYAAFVSLVHPDDSARVESHMGEAFGHKLTFNVDFRIVRPDGSERAVHCEGEIAIDKDGKPVKMFGTCQDITERIRLENELRNAYDSLKEAYERKTDFTNAAAHELRTPLTPIIGYTDILKAEVKDERHRAFLEIIERNALRQKNLVNRMLELASLDAGMAHVNCSELAVRPLAVEIADNYRAVNPRIRVEVPDDLRINTDPDILRHVLDNLVSNAVKYSDRGQEIEIMVTDAGDSYRFSVRDRGAGIPKEEWGKIFERFYIVGGDSDSRTSGRSGLGLALVKAYISLIGGQVWLESEPGKGSTFFFTVPRKLPSDGKSH